MSRLEEKSIAFRENLIAKNDYTKNDQYTVGHPDALSTGDEQGKGMSNGDAGNATDIKTRKTLISKNQYNYNREYNAGTV